MKIPTTIAAKSASCTGLFRATILLAVVWLHSFCPSVYAGEWLWVKPSGGSGADIARAVAVDLSGNTVIAGNYGSVPSVFSPAISVVNENADATFTVAKYDPAGSCLWVRTSSASTSTNRDARGVAVDSSGNVYATGTISGIGTITFGPGISVTTATASSQTFVVKYDASGVCLWARLISGSGNVLSRCIAVDSSGKVAVGGFFATSATFASGVTRTGGSQTLFLATYDTDGVFQWAKAAGGATSLGEARSVAFDSDGNIIVGGLLSGAVALNLGDGVSVKSAGNNDALVAKFDAAGTCLWARIGGGASSSDFANAVALDSSGSVYVAGQFGSAPATFGSAILTNGGGFDVFVAKYDTDGAFQWARRAGGSSTDAALGIGVDAAGSATVAGFFSGSATFGAIALTAFDPGQELFLAKYDSDGTVISARNAGAAVASSNEAAVAVAVMPGGDAYVAGNTGANGGTMTFAPGVSFTSAGGSDVFLAKFGTLVPTVTSATSVLTGADTATLGGNVTSDGYTDITERGVVYSMTSANNDPRIDGSGVTKIVADGETGVFAVEATGLLEGTGYSYKAYAINSVGTSYTATAVFRTNSRPTDIALSNATIPEMNAANASIGTLSAADFDGGDTHTFTFAGGLDDAAFSITGNTLAIKGSADFETKSSYSIRIRATDSGAGHLTFEKSFTVSITDVLLPQTITFAPIANRTFGASDFQVSGTGGASGNAVVFSILDGPASLSGNTVRITGAGSVTVRATQAGGGDYIAAIPVDRTFTVAKAAQLISFAPPAKAATIDSVTLSATGGSSGIPITFSLVSGPALLVGNELSFSSVGDVVVRASQSGNANYLVASDVVATIRAVINARPVLADDAATMTAGASSVYPLANDSDPEGQTLSIISVSDASVLIDGRSLIVPAGFTGTFSYRATDGVSSATAHVAVSVGKTESAPTTWSGLLFDSAGAIAGRGRVSRSAAGMATLSIQVGSTRKTVVQALSGTTASLPVAGIGDVALSTDAVTGRVELTLQSGVTGSLRAATTSATAATYNVALGGTSSAVTGSGYFSVRVKPPGVASVAGKLPDGSGFTATSDLNDNGSLSFFTKLYAGPAGRIAGELVLADLSKTDATGEFEWRKTVGSALSSVTTIDTVLTANASAVSNSTGIPNGPVEIAYAGRAFVEPVVFTSMMTDGVVGTTAGRVASWRTSATKGGFNALFLDPVTYRAHVGIGLYLPKSHTAIGRISGGALHTTISLRVE